MDHKKIMASAKGKVTRVITQLEKQEPLGPEMLQESTLDRLLTRLTEAEDTYDQAYKDIPEPSEEIEISQSEFLLVLDTTRDRVQHLKSVISAHAAEEDLQESLSYWESLKGDQLCHTVDRDVHTLEKQLDTYIELTRPRKLASSARIKDLLKTMRIRVNNIKCAGTPTSSSSPSTAATASTTADPATSIRQGVKARTLPLPIYSGDLSDWRSFWRRFKDYLGKMPGLSNDEQLTFLLECIKEPAAVSMIQDALRNGNSFEFVEGRLKTRFDQPRRVFTDMAVKLTKLPEFRDTDKGTATCSELLTKYLNIIDKFGDGSASQLVTAFFEAMMDNTLSQEWYRFLVTADKVPHAEKMVEFMDTRNRILTSKSVDSKPSHFKPSPNNTWKNSSSKMTAKGDKPKPHYALVANSTPTCGLCNEKEHALYYCNKFKEMEAADRRKHMSSTNHCFNCLGPGHTAKQCHSKKTCKTCSGKHHSMLHVEDNKHTTSSGSNTSPTSSNSSSNSQPEITLALPVPRPTAILWVCKVLVEQGGRSCVVRGIIDTGSTISLITEKIVKSLKLQTTPTSTDLSGVGSTPAGTIKAEALITLKSLHDPTTQPISMRAAVIRSIVGDKPTTNLKDVDTSFTESITLSDPNFQTPGGIDILLGQDVIKSILKDGVVRSNINDLYAINTTLGWVVGGCCNNSTQAVTTHVCYHVAPTTTDTLLKAFWESEEPPKSTLLTPEDQGAMAHFKSTHSRQQDGRYMVKLPRRDTDIKLGDSYRQAVQRYRSNKHSLLRKGKWEDFSEAVLEYASLGHAELVPLSELNHPTEDVYFLPMHGVFKESSTTTKLRVVFDASAASSTGHSLNDILIPGPISYPPLINVLLRFRLHKVGLTADISKMFREVALHPQDKDLHRFLMENNTGDLQQWRMVRLTFGVNCSPFLATQVLRQLAEDYQEQYPAASKAILSSFYVDDFLSGAETVEEASHLRSSLTELLSLARMTLRKWRTNSSDLRNSIPPNLLETEEVQVIQPPAECHKTLGIHWRTATDTLHVATPQLCKTDIPTKRQVLSDVARTFDVLGWYTPATISLKILLQRIWQMGLEWDEALPQDLCNTWKLWREELPLITEHSLSRCYFLADKTIQMLQLHGFCDASQLSIAAVVYVRAMYSDSQVSVHIVLAKSKVAPIKPQTIPKLELAAAVLLSKLLQTVQSELNIVSSSVFAWSDSTIALGWIRTPPVKLKTYVANRVVQITEALSPSHWRHVPSQHNPADVASRGTSIGDLLQHHLWWNGPEWLRSPPTDWPSLTGTDTLSTPLPELKSFALVIEKEPNHIECLLTRFSNYTLCVHAHAWMYRFIANCRTSRERRQFSSTLTMEEITHAETLLVKRQQHQYYHKDMDLLASGHPVPALSSLHTVHPFLDKDGLFRVGGRLQKSGLNFQQKHPIILNKKSHLTLLLVRHLHISNHHAGPTLLMGLLSSTHYIPGARRLVRAITHGCVTCRKEYARTSKQLMGQLPKERVQPSPPFSKTGTDFAGPLTLKKGHTRKPVHVKGYVCIFICLSTHAVHIELVMELSTEAFMAAFRRFCARRGCPEKMVSDNGSNYIGANRELAKLYDLLTAESKTLTQFFHTKRVDWSFIPGRAPHFGGIWEAAVKSVKTYLRKTVGSYVLSVEEAITILVEIEATMNSRPLCPMDTMPDDGVEALTPAHFLVGRSLRALPAPTSTDMVITASKRWNLCQKLSADFWDRWSKEYLQLLQKRNKWTKTSDNIYPGQLVLLKDQEMFQRNWPLAVVQEIFPGQDGLVRAVDIRTSKGVYRRPVHKLVPLLNTSESSSSFRGGGCSGHA